MVNLLSRLLLFLLPLHCFMACLASNSENITTDQSALLAFKSLITSDPYDMLANNWSTSSSICNWVGVACDERHRRVSSLILPNMRLRGNVSPNLGNLSFLVILDLKNNSFGGQLPKELCRLHRLKELHISYNEFEGGIPAALGDLSQLQHLFLGVNNFSGIIPQSIGNLQRLKELDTSQNRLSGPIPQTISNMSSLEILYLYSNHFSGKIPSLNNMTSLRVIELGNNNLNGRLPNDFFNQLPQLEDFTLANNQFEGSIPRSIGNCTSLISLQLESNFFTEYGSKGIVSVKGDVYSYGIMLMEIFTRRKPTDDMFAAELSLKTWIGGSLPNAIMEVLDSNLVQLNGDQIDLSFHMSSIFSLSLKCCEDSPEARIDMKDVIASLIKIKTLVLGANWVKL